MEKLKIMAVVLAASMLTGCTSYSTNSRSSIDADSIYNFDGGIWAGQNYNEDINSYYYYDENAEYNADEDTVWASVPSFSQMNSFIEYMRERYNNHETEVYVQFENGFLPDPDEILNKLSIPWLNTEVHYNDGESARVIYKTLLYPGTKVADAYLSGDKSLLTKEEQKLYNTAAKLVEEAKDMDSDLKAELYLHDKICEATTYHNEDFKENLPRHCTALGVFLDGKANCQGYADAFYMLAKMYGFETDKLTGSTEDGLHVWNLIKLGTRWYAVDCCWNDDALVYNGISLVQYYYFNAPTEVMSADHYWDSDATNRNLQRRIDDKYFYGANEADDTYFGLYENDIENALEYCAEQLMENDNCIYIMAHSDKKYDDTDEICNEINRIIEAAKHPYSISYTVYLNNLENYTYLYVMSD